MTLMNLELEILLVLRDAGDRLLPQSTLVSSLRMRDRGESLAQINGCLRDLESRDQIHGVNNPDAGNKWKLSDEGLVRLHEANL